MSTLGMNVKRNPQYVKWWNDLKTILYTTSESEAY